MTPPPLREREISPQPRDDRRIAIRSHCTSLHANAWQRSISLPDAWRNPPWGGSASPRAAPSTAVAPLPSDRRLRPIGQGLLRAASRHLTPRADLPPEITRDHRDHQPPQCQPEHRYHATTRHAVMPSCHHAIMPMPMPSSMPYQHVTLGAESLARQRAHRTACTSIGGGLARARPSVHHIRSAALLTADASRSMVVV